VTVQFESLQERAAEAPSYDSLDTRRRGGHRAVAGLALDAVALTLAALASTIGAERAGAATLPVRWTILFGVLALVLYVKGDGYRWRIRLDPLDDVRLVLKHTTTAALVVLAAWTLLQPDDVKPAALVRLWVFAAAFALLNRLTSHAEELRARRAGAALRPAVIAGAGEVGSGLALRLLSHREFGLLPIGFLDDDPLERDEQVLPLLGGVADIERVVATHGVDQLIITFSRAPHEDLIALADRARQLGVDVVIVPRLFEKTAQRPDVVHVGGLALLHMRLIDPRGWYFHVKYVADRLFALLLLVACLPVLLAAAVAIRLSMGRPILFRQVRVGRDGKPFSMMKFRTMGGEPVSDTAVDLPPDIAPGGNEGSDRTTAVGRLLRRTSIDELPQLLNVLRGEMSLIGPRPERPLFVDRFRESVKGYDRRHRVKAGITGWAQVHGLRGPTSVSERAEWDNYYIDNFSFWLDLKIVALTIVAVIRGALART
jgi:exopolysaccharide biosynthesis polyprenyl glycosylphosphotransferase